MSIIEKTEKVYSGPEKSVYPQIGTLFAGDSYTKIWDEFGYAYIEYPVTNGVKRGYIEGYASNQYPPAFQASVLGIVKNNVGSVSVASSPDAGRIAIGSLSAGEQVSVLITNHNNFYYVEYGSSSGAKRGWVQRTFLNLLQDTALARINTNAPVYTTAAVDTSIGSVFANEIVGVLSENEYFGKIEYCISASPFRKQAFIEKKNYTKLNSSKELPEIPTYDSNKGVQAVVSLSALVYSGPEKEIYAQIGSISKDENVRVISYEQEYFQISYQSTAGIKRGYVHRDSFSNANGIISAIPNVPIQLVGYSEFAVGTSLTTYTGPASSFVVAGQVASQEPVTRLNIEENGYVMIEYSTANGTKRGYLPISSVTKTNNGLIAYSNGYNGVYYYPDFKYLEGSVYKNEYVVILAKCTLSNGAVAYLVEYNTNNGRKRGFMRLDSITIIGNRPVSVHLSMGRLDMASGSAQTVYGGPNDKFAVIGSIGQNEPVIRYYEDGRYSYIAYTAGTIVKCGFVNTSELQNNSFVIKDYTSNTEFIQYGTSGMGIPLYAYKLGNGKNHLILNFAIHGWEDIWSYSGRDIEKVGEAVLEHFKNDSTPITQNDWTLFVILASNPDGLLYGVEHDGPGRCTVKRYGASREELVDGGIDMNRSFQYKNAAGQVSFDISNTPRNYTGPEANWCKESEALKAFIDSHKSENGVNVFIDTHGYTTQIITSASARDSSNHNSVLYNIFSKIFLPVPSQDVSSFGETFARYATEYNNAPGYVARYVHDLQGMDGCLFEFPGIYTSAGQIFDRGLHTRYIQAITNILTTYPR